jgi:putative transposase
MAYSKDLRRRLIAAVEKGRSRRSQAKLFEVDPSTAVKWVAVFHAEGRAAPKPHAGGRRSQLDTHVAWLRARVAAKADITLLELCAELAARGVVTSKSALSRFFDRIGYSFKKKRAGLRAGSSGRGGGTRRMGGGSERARSEKARLHR